MNWVVARIRGILLVSGALTCSMISAAIAPDAALRLTFGEALQGPLAEILVRSWGSLVALVGAALIYAAYDAGSRRLVLAIAALGKVFFVGLVLAYGRRYLPQAALVIVSDTAMAALFIAYLAAAGRRAGISGRLC